MLTITKIVLKALVWMTITLVKEHECFGIVNCGSNKIINTTLNVDTGKYMINYDKDSKVPLDTPNEVTLWCESNSKYDRCEIRSESTKCSWSHPLRCNDDSVCENDNRIEYVYNPDKPNVCTFKLTSLKKYGKWMLSKFC